MSPEGQAAPSAPSPSAPPPQADVRQGHNSNSFADSLLDDFDDAPASPPAKADAQPAPSSDPADSSGTPPSEPAQQAAWPGDWREQLAGGDEKILADLKRMATPGDWAKSTRALRQKLSSGEYKRDVPFPADGTPEQQAAWREERGLPKAPTEYQPTKIEGFEWSDADKPALDAVFDRLHKVNAPQPVVDQVLGFYADAVRTAKTAEVEADKALKIKAEDDLRSTYGDDFRGNMNLYVRALKDSEFMPREVADLIGMGRGPNGERMLNHPAIAKWMIGMARERYGDAGMVSGSQMEALSSREEQILKVMKSDFNKYLSEGLDKELAGIRAKKSGGKGGSYQDED